MYVTGEDTKIAIFLGMIARTECMARSQQGHRPGQVVKPRVMLLPGSIDIDIDVDLTRGSIL